MKGQTQHVTIHAVPSLLHAAVLLVDATGDEGSNRRRVFSYVQAHPGLHQREIARGLDLNPATAEQHLRHLERVGLLQRQEETGFVWYYIGVAGVVAPEGAVAPVDKPRLAVLRQARPLQIVARLLASGELRMSDLAQQVGISPGALTYQVKKLEAVGILQRVEKGSERWVGLQDRDGTVQFLLAYQPPDDLVAGFEDLWEEVGF